MDSPLHSPQPETVTLVRADLAEVFPIDDARSGSPEVPPSPSKVSDMLDLESIPTPRFRPWKAKKDPLPDMLMGVVGSSPEPPRGQNDVDDRNVEFAVDNRLLGALGQDISSDDGPQLSDDHGPNRDGTPEPEYPPHLESPQPNKNRRRRTTRRTPTATAPAHSGKTRPQRQSRSKAAAPSDANRAPAKQTKQVMAPPKPVKAAPPGTRQKGGKRDDDPFELSDTTDTEAVSRPKKRQAKEPPSTQPHVASASRNRVTGTGVGSPIGIHPKRKQPRVPKKPVIRQARETNKIDIPPADSDQDYEMEDVLSPQPYNDTSTVTKLKPNERSPLDRPTLTLQSANIPGPSAPMDPNKPSAGPQREKEVLLPRAPDNRDVIVSSESAEPRGAAPESTSPLFTHQDQEYTLASSGPDITVTIEPGPSSGCSQRIRATEPADLQLASPRSFQPRTLPSSALETSLEDGIIPHSAPLGRGVGLSHKLPEVTSSPPVPAAQDSSQHRSSDPGEMWKQATEDDSPPAVLHRIVALLHRSLKPKEEVVRDIANDYKENALRLLKNLTARHEQEKRDTTKALRNASRVTVSVFSHAANEMKALIGRLRDMDVTRTADALRRPVLAQKLDAVSRLCEMRLSGKNRPPAGSDPDDSEPEMADEGLDELAEGYRLRLHDAVQRPEGQAAEARGTMDSEVDSFIARRLQGESTKVRQTEPPTSRRSDRTADEALEEFLDRIIRTLQESGSEDGFDQARHDSNEHVVEVLSD